MSLTHSLTGRAGVALGLQGAAALHCHTDWSLQAGACVCYGTCRGLAEVAACNPSNRKVVMHPAEAPVWTLACRQGLRRAPAT